MVWWVLCRSYLFLFVSLGGVLWCCGVPLACVQACVQAWCHTSFPLVVAACLFLSSGGGAVVVVCIRICIRI